MASTDVIKWVNCIVGNVGQSVQNKKGNISGFPFCFMWLFVFQSQMPTLSTVQFSDWFVRLHAASSQASEVLPKTSKQNLMSKIQSNIYFPF